MTLADKLAQIKEATIESRTIFVIRGRRVGVPVGRYVWTHRWGWVRLYTEAA